MAKRILVLINKQRKNKLNQPKHWSTSKTSFRKVASLLNCYHVTIVTVEEDRSDKESSIHKKRKLTIKDRNF